MLLDCSELVSALPEEKMLGCMFLEFGHTLLQVTVER